ncbi:MAG: LITAF-like zinc ribbon domain-containing protein [Promethearchaeota archaeon]
MGNKKKFAYCNNCEKEILTPKRRSIDSMYYNVWILTIISSLGFAFIPFLVYRYVVLRKNLCSTCYNKLKFYRSRDEIPEPKAEIRRILQTIEQEKQEKDETKICSFCQEAVSYKEEICPNCGSILKEEK